MSQKQMTIKHSVKTKCTEHKQKSFHDIILESFENVTYSLASAGFLGIALLQLVATVFAIVTEDTSAALSNSLGSSVCLIAGYHYKWMRGKNEDNMSIIATRYSDWYITTILMLVEFFNLAGTLVSKWQWLLASCLSCELMILSGHIATVREKHQLSYYYTFGAGILFGIVLITCYTFGTIVDKPENYTMKNNDWMHIFAILWIFYPIAFWAQKYKNLAYNIFDIYSKGIFGIVLAILTFISE